MAYASVPLRPAVLRFIPEPPGHPGSWTGVNRVKVTFSPPKNLDGRPSRPSKTREHPEAPRFIQVEPRQGHGSSRRLHGSPRFSGRFSTVHPGPCRQNPGDATVLPGYLTAELRSFPVRAWLLGRAVVNLPTHCSKCVV